MIMCDVRVYASIPNTFAKTFLCYSRGPRSLQLQRKDRTRNTRQTKRDVELGGKLCRPKSFAAPRVLQEEQSITGNRGRYPSRIRHPQDKQACRQHGRRHPCRIRHHPRLRRTCRYGWHGQPLSSLLALPVNLFQQQPSASARHRKPPRHGNVGSSTIRGEGRESPKFRA